MKTRKHPTHKLFLYATWALFMVSIVVAGVWRDSVKDAAPEVVARVELLSLLGVVGVFTAGLYQMIVCKCPNCRGRMFFPEGTDVNGQFQYHCDRCDIDWGTGIYMRRGPRF